MGLVQYFNLFLLCFFCFTGKSLVSRFGLQSAARESLGQACDSHRRDRGSLTEMESRLLPVQDLSKI